MTLSKVVEKHRNAYFQALTNSNPVLRIHYIDCEYEDPSNSKGVILLIHGFPQTSYQYRNVIRLLAEAGYRVIAPDYRGAGESSHPLQDYDKVTMASDLHRLLSEHLDIKEKVHVIGHDIGAMIAYAYITEYPESSASIIWGECPLPGSIFYDQCRNNIDKFHFNFHCVPDGLPEALVSGREAIYLKQFFDRQIAITEGINKQDFDHYVHLYSLPDAMRSAFEVYRAFPKDKERNVEYRAKNGKLNIQNMILSGQVSNHAVEARQMAEEFFQDVQEDVVEGSAHYVAEENPSSFVSVVVRFLDSTGE
jgi:pimeloyl-ACP methyl ester carboxylesterase